MRNTPFVAFVRTPLALATFLVPIAAQAQAAPDCAPVLRRNTQLLEKAALRDLALAGHLEEIAQTCPVNSASAACREARAACFRWLREDQEVSHHHNEAHLRAHMTSTWFGERFPMSPSLGAETPHAPVRCEQVDDAAKSAADRRAVAARHRLVASEYERFMTWAQARHAACVAKAHATEPAATPATEKVVVVVAPATGSGRTAPTSGTSQAIPDAQARQRELEAARQAEARARAASDAAARAREEAAQRQREAAEARARAQAEEARRQQEVAAAAALARAEAERRERELREAEARRAEEEARRMRAERAEAAASDEAEAARERREREVREAEARAAEEAERRRREVAEAEARAEEEAERRRREVEEAEARRQAEVAAAKEAAAALEAAKERELEEAEERAQKEREARAREEAARREEERRKAAQAKLEQEIQAARREAAQRKEEAKRAELERREEAERQARAMAEAAAAARRQERATLARERAEQAERYEAERARLTTDPDLGQAERQSLLAALAAQHQQRLAEFQLREAQIVERERQDALAAQRFAEEEARRREEMDRRIAAMDTFRHPRARSGGALGLGFAVGIAGGDTQPLGGLALQVRHAFWFEPPAEGLASGVELLASAQGLDPAVLGGAAGAGTPDGSRLVGATGEVRAWISRLAIGAAIDLRDVAADAPRQPISGALRAGPSLGFALVDRYDSRVVFGARWLPLPNGGTSMATADAELAWRFLFATVHAGTTAAEEGGAPPLFAAGSAGVRLRW